MEDIARRVLLHLDAHQTRLIAGVLNLPGAGRPKFRLTQGDVHNYLRAYFSSPLEVTRAQNDYIKALALHERQHFFKPATQLNYLAERYAHIRPYDEPSPKTHEQVEGIEYIFHGDLMPGTRFVLDQPWTHDRNYLPTKKNSRNTLPYTIGARMLAVGGTNQHGMACILLEHAVHEKGGPKREIPARAILGPASIRAMGDDVCRDKGALLTLCLQEAGIKARYVRGNIDGINSRGQRVGGRHVWVEAQLDGKNYRLDPQWGLLLPLGKSRMNTTPTHGNPVYTPDRNLNILWRRKRVS